MIDRAFFEKKFTSWKRAPTNGGAREGYDLSALHFFEIELFATEIFLEVCFCAILLDFQDNMTPLFP